MKIAILSLVPGQNYGGILQSYALKEVLVRSGHQVEVITKEYENKGIKFSLLPHYFSRILKRLLGKSKIRIFAECHRVEDRSIVFCHMLRFCNEYLNLRPIRSFSEIKDFDYDAFIVGSDQVWRPRYFEEEYEESISNAFLGFAEGWEIRRVSYAASFGVDFFEYSESSSKICGHLLSLFDFVSVREHSAAAICKKHWGIDAMTLCDPTLLLKRSDYVSLIEKGMPHSGGNLLVYCLDDNDEFGELVKLIAQEKNLTPFTINNKKDFHYDLVQRIKPSVESWLKGFVDAEFVVTDSFHACVFSLLFHKPFLVMANSSRGVSRIETLLEQFHQERRILFRASQFNNSLLDLPLDGVDETVTCLQSEAMAFLNNALSYECECN